MNFSRALTREIRYSVVDCHDVDDRPQQPPSPRRAARRRPDDATGAASRTVRRRPAPRTPGPSWTNADQRHAIDFRRVALVVARRDGDLVLARQVGIVAIAVEEAGRLRQQAGHVEMLFLIDAAHRASGDIAHHVAASAHRGQARALELVEDLRETVECDVVELDVLTGGQFALIAAILLGYFTDGAQTRRGSGFRSES